MKSFEALLNKKMTRKGFVTQVGIEILALTGVTGAVKKINNLGVSEKQSVGFGSGAYSGKDQA